MNTDITTLPATAKPFASFMDATASMQAHERMSGHALRSVIHRPLDERQFRQLGAAVTSEFDDLSDADGDQGTEFGSLS